MNLSVLERIVILKVLPKEADYATHRIMTNLRLALSFTEEEIKAWGIEPTAGGTRWEINGETDIPIGERATDIIMDALKRLNREKKLLPEDLSVYEKFIPTTE